MVVFETTGVSPKTRFDYWHDVICQHFVPADSKLEARSDFDARFQTNALGPFAVSRLSAPRHSWARKEEHVRRAPHEDFLLSLKLGGETCLSQDGREVRQRPGELALYDTSQPFRYFLESDIVLVKIPRRELLARVPQAGRFVARGFGLGSPVGALARDLVRQSLDLDLSANPAAAERLGASVLDAAAAALEWELVGNAGPVSKQVALLNRVKSHILANLPDRTLDADHIAARHHISARTLNRLFALEGTTPMRWIWNQRLEACYGALNGTSSSVTDVAFTFGFSDLSHFCRSFKARFGVSPSAVSG